MAWPERSRGEEEPEPTSREAVACGKYHPTGREGESVRQEHGRKQAAAVGTPVKEETTALPPVNNMDVTRMLVKSQKVM